METMTDPVLQCIAEREPAELERCLVALADLNEKSAEALAHLESLPVALMLSLAKHVDKRVRAAVAAHPACPPEILLLLSQDAVEEVRVSLASNECMSVDLLLTLATDPSEWVRSRVARNPRGTDVVRAAVALSSSPEQMARLREQTSALPPESDPATPPGQLREIAEAVMARGAETRTALARNPSLPDDLVDRLVQVAREPREVLALWDNRVGANPADLLWPSTYAFLSDRSPDWLLDVLARCGHPAALLFPELPTGTSPSHAAIALRELVDSRLLIRALWRELALARVVQLNYVRNYETHDFFPNVEGLRLLNQGSPAARIIASSPWEVEWIELEDSLSIDQALDLGGSGFDEFFTDGFGEGEELDIFSLRGLGYVEREIAYREGRLRWTAAGEAAVIELLIPLVHDNAEGPDFDTSVTVVESTIQGVGYEMTSGEQKVALMRLLKDARVDRVVGAWGISDHFLMCMGLHPATPQKVRDELLADPIENVRMAARRGADLAV
jgi:hypothetical protein